MKGRKPLPTNLKIMRGTARKSRLKNEATPSLEMPPKPAYLTELESQLWDDIGPRLLQAGLLTDLDGVALESLVSLQAHVIEAERQLRETGGRMIANSSNDAVTNPAWLHARDARRDLLKWCAEFGLTPSSRGRISIPKAPTESTIRKRQA